MTQHTTARSIEYQPEIDGLRAIAVLAVFAFHLDHQWLPGGFVGVDVFFVISGFLITAILYRECANGNFSLSGFYQRRVARLFPAFFTVALVTAAVASILYSPQDLASAGANLASAALSVANMKLMLQGDYFEISADSQPFLHYWSLSVEEQFYVIFPLLLFILFQYAKEHLIALLSVIGLGSFIACVALTKINSVWAFYLLPTRAWELGVGGLVAIALATNSRLLSAIPQWFFPFGLLLIIASFMLIEEGKEFPGWQVALPVLGAAAIMATSSRSKGWAKSFLSSSAMVTVGWISYSLYLWHWPVFSFVDYHFYLASAEVRLLAKISISFLLAFVTYRLIERPSRRFLAQLQHRRTAYSAMAALLVVSVLVGIGIRQLNYVSAAPSDIANGGLAFDGKATGPTVTLLGDSNGSMYGKVLREICAELCRTLYVMSVDAGDSLPSTVGQSSRLWLDMVTGIRKTNPDYLILANNWSAKLETDRERLLAALAELAPHVGRIILLNQPPYLPEGVNRKAMREGLRPPFFEDSQVRTKRQTLNEFLEGATSSDIAVVNVSKHFETKDGEILFVDEHGRPLYQDRSHISAYGAERIRPLLMHAISDRTNSRLQK